MPDYWSIIPATPQKRLKLRSVTEHALYIIVLSLLLEVFGIIFILIVIVRRGSLPLSTSVCGDSNDFVLERVQSLVGPQGLLSTIKKCKFKLYSHTYRHDTLEKTIMEGTVKGGRRRGRQHQGVHLHVII